LNVPFVDLKPQHEALKADILAAWQEILEASQFLGSPHVEAFESAFAEACEAPHCVGVSSGTDALVLGLKALGVEAGDEVIVPANTYIATAAAIAHAGARPVFVDVLRGTWNIDPEALKAAITPRTVGVVGVHLYGQPFDVDSVSRICEKKGLWLMEDAAQAHLATYKDKKVGSLSHCAAFSFYPSKNLGAPGDGGAIVTRDEAIARKVKRLRNHGQEEKNTHVDIGYTARLVPLMAAALAVKLPHLMGWTEERRAHAQNYLDRLAACPGVELPMIANWAKPVWHLFVIHVQKRDQVHTFLNDKGIGVGQHYPVPCPFQPAFSHLGYQQGDFPVSELNATRGLSLPIYAGLKPEAVAYVCEQVKLALDANH
jgi:dTDP-4-amino-4,6-dideoxygalactose transaminase